MVTEGCGDSVVGDVGAGLAGVEATPRLWGPWKAPPGCLGWSEQALGLCVGPGG